MLYIYIYHYSTRGKRWFVFVVTWIEIEAINLSEISQGEGQTSNNLKCGV